MSRVKITDKYFVVVESACMTLQAFKKATNKVTGEEYDTFENLAYYGDWGNLFKKLIKLLTIDKMKEEVCSLQEFQKIFEESKAELEAITSTLF